jgi:hypothetical protein
MTGGLWKMAKAALAPYRTAAIVAALVVAIGGLGWIIWRAADTVGDARELNVTREITTRGQKDADAISKGEFDVHACRASGRVWNISRGACVDR